MDSDEGTRRLVRRILAHEGIVDVHEAGNGAHGLALIERYEPDLVILEDVLPLVSGLECLQSLRASEKSRKTAVIVTSHTNTEAAVREFIAFGIEDYIVKPLRPRLFQERIAKTLRMLGTHPVGAVPTSDAHGLEFGSPVLLVDGSEEYREFFAAQAGNFFRVLTAPSGAEGLAIAVDALPRAIFFGENTGLLDQQRFVAKVRGVRELRAVLLFKFAVPGEARTTPEQMDGVLVRSFAPDVLRFELARLLKPGLMVEALLAPATATSQTFMRAAAQAVEFTGLSVHTQLAEGPDAVGEDVLSARVELHGTCVGVEVVATTTHVNGRGVAAALLGRVPGTIGKVEVEDALKHVLQAAAGRLAAAFAERGLSLAMSDCRLGNAPAGDARPLLDIDLLAADARMRLGVRLLGPKVASPSSGLLTPARVRTRLAPSLLNLSRAGAYPR